MKSYVKVLLCFYVAYLVSILVLGSPLNSRHDLDDPDITRYKIPVRIEDKLQETSRNKGQKSQIYNQNTLSGRRKHSLKISRFLNNPAIEFPKGYDVTGLESKLQAYKETLPNPDIPFLIPPDVLHLPDLAEIDGHIVRVFYPKKDPVFRTAENEKGVNIERNSRNSGIQIEISQHESVKNDQNDLKNLDQNKDIYVAGKQTEYESEFVKGKGKYDSQEGQRLDAKYSYESNTEQSEKLKVDSSKDYSDYVDYSHDYYDDHQDAGNDDVQREAGYDDAHRETGYDDAHSEAGYDDAHSEAGYDDAHSEAGYDDAHREAGYDDAHSEAGYNDAHSEAEYNDVPQEAEYGDVPQEAEYGDVPQEAEYGDGHPDDYYDYYDGVDEGIDPRKISHDLESVGSIENSEKEALRNTTNTAFKRKGDLNATTETLNGSFENNKTGRLLEIFTRTNISFECTTPKNESGQCRSFSECPILSIVNNYNLFLQYMCLRGLFVGICCPENPVIEITDSDGENSTESVVQDIKQPPEGCGLTHNTRIVGGTISVPHEWSWMVALTRRDRFFCGGVIINNWYILTAAHCVLGVNVKDLKVRLGEYNFMEKNQHREDIPVAEIKRHAMFVTLTFQHDIALLKLKRKIEYSKFVGSICLPERTGRNYSDAKATVVGWGTVSFGGAASPVLRQVSIPVWENEDCDRTYFLENIDDSFMCAGSPENGEDACQGDSGGPLMTLNSQERWEVIGIVSWGRRCGDPTYPGVYTRVTSYLDWIAAHAQ